MKVWEFEEKVWEVEGIRIVIRAASEENVSNYTFKNSAQEGWRVTQLIEKRLQPKIGDYEVIIIQGDGEQPHGRVILRSVRRTYS
ncbi:MAG: hypothetical protein JRI37_13565 [Deltaproteobacteria bacterium]|nr:hypothetical protein [Deltaproteobacteria bacterium]